MTGGLSKLLLSLGVAVAIVFGAWLIPLGIEEEPVFFEADLGEKTQVTLASGESYRRTFLVSDQPIKGVMVYSPGGQRVDGVVMVRIRADDELVAFGNRLRQYYKNDSTHLVVPVQPFSLPERTLVQLEVTRVSGAPLVLKIAQESGALTTSLLHPAPLDFGTRQGVLVGLTVLVAVSLISVWQRYRWVAVGLLVVVIVPVALAGFLFPSGELGISDWDYFFTVHESYRRGFFDLQVFPFWNPYTCGGTAGLADPEFPVFSVVYPLELLFGVSVGLRLAVVASVSVAALGMLVLGRRLGFSVNAALLASLGFAFSTTTLLKLVEGQIVMFSAMWLPWIFWSWLGAYRRRAGPLLCGVFLALTFLQGGVHILLYTIPALLLVSLLVSDKRRGLVVTWWAGLWAVGLSAVKLVPALWWAQQFPDEAYAVSAFTLPWLHEIFLGRHLHGADVIPGQGGGWHEYGAYLGPIIVALALLGLARWRRSRVVRGLVVGIALAIILSSLGPWLEPLLDLVPQMPRSYTSRVNILTVLGLALLAGFGLDVLGRWSRSGWIKVLRSLLVGFVAIDLISLAYPLSERAFILPEVTGSLPEVSAPLAFTRETHKVRVGPVEYDRAYAAARQGYGTLTYCSVLSPKIAVVPVNEPDNEYVRLQRGEGDVDLVEWSFNRVVVRANAAQSATVVINTNFAEGWLANGRPAESVDGRVGARIPVGEQVVVFRYRPPGFLTGLSVSVITLVLVAWFTFYKSRRS